MRVSARTIRSHIESLRTTTRDVQFDELTERVRREPGGVLAEPMDVLVLAGRPVEFEPLIFTFQEAAGYWQATPILTRICSGQIRLVVLAYSLDEAATIMQGDYHTWAPAIVSALKDTMVLDRLQASRFVYTPREPIGGTCAYSRA